MKKLIAVLLVLLVAAAFVFACEHTNDGTDCSWCSAKYCAGAQAALGATAGGMMGGAAGPAGAAAGAASLGAAGAVSGFFDGLDGKCFSD